MREAEYRRNCSDWFNNKTAKLSRTIKNGRGENIVEGEMITIICKSARNGLSPDRFDVISKQGIFIMFVPYLDIDLV